MSELQDTVRRGVEALNANDAETLVAISHPDIEFIPMRAPVQGVFRGHQGMREFVADNAQNFELFHVTVEEMHEAPGGRVVTLGTLRIRGRGSGAEVTTPTASVATLSEGKITRFEEFGDRALALAAAGLGR